MLIKECHLAVSIWYLMKARKKESEVAQLCRLFATPGTVACQAPPSTGFSKQEYWSGLLFPSPGDCPDPGIEPGFPALQADSLPAEPLGHKTFQSLMI